MFYRLKIAGVRRLTTHVSHGRKDAGPELIAAMAKQVGVSAPYFRGMIACTNDCDDYYARLMADPSLAQPR